MRKKIAMRWRREALRRGAVITDEKPVFNKQELKENGLRKKDAGFSFKAEYKGYKWMIAGDDALAAYKLFVQAMDNAEEMHWIDRGYEVECPACGFTCNDEYYLGDMVACPNCGARVTQESEN